MTLQLPTIERSDAATIAADPLLIDRGYRGKNLCEAMTPAPWDRIVVDRTAWQETKRLAEIGAAYERMQKLGKEAA